MTASRVGSNRMLSSRLAPSVAQPTAKPLASVATDHFQPDLARSQGFFAGSFPTGRCLVPAAVNRNIGKVEAHNSVVGRQRFGYHSVEHSRVCPLVASGPQCGIGHCSAREVFGGHP